MKKTLKNIGLQFFAEPAPADPAPGADPAPAEPQSADPQPVNYDELIEKDKTLQSWLDSRISKATQTAVEKAKGKWQQTQNDQRTEAEKLASMSSDEKAAYFEKKYQDEIASRQRMENASALERQTATIFKEGGIPDELMSMIDFASASAEGIKKHVELLSGFEYHKKGDFEKAVTEGINARLKQPSPQSHSDGTKPEGKTVAEAVHNKMAAFTANQ